MGLYRQPAWWLLILLAVAAPSWAQAPTPDPEAELSAAPPPTESDKRPPVIDPLHRLQASASAQSLIGQWTAPVNGQTIALSLHEDHTYTLADQSGSFTVRDGQLILETADGPVTYTYAFTPTGELQITGGTLAGPLTFTRQLAATRFFSRLFNTSRQVIVDRLRRILFIIAVVVIARLIIAGMGLISRLLIASERGPAAYLFRTNKNRARTVHSLVLNIVKYFIYFTALGMILETLGINYTTYIASLSVIGLAIGFGSQGLVQDMVTGFFIVFENQFDVGDMVEISGQTGYVVELGLRMTKIRNYLGQVVVIPNRNIAIVGTYSRGAQRAYIDVAVESPAAGMSGLPVLQQVGEEVMKQFEGVVLGPLRTTGPVSLATGEHFIRLHLSVWPKELWVIDQQLAPRIREAFKRAEIVIPADRVVVHYHARQRVAVTRWQDRLPWRSPGDRDQT